MNNDVNNYFWGPILAFIFTSMIGAVWVYMGYNIGALTYFIPGVFGYVSLKAYKMSGANVTKFTKYILFLIVSVITFYGVYIKFNTYVDEEYIKYHNYDTVENSSLSKKLAWIEKNITERNEKDAYYLEAFGCIILAIITTNKLANIKDN